MAFRPAFIVACAALVATGALAQPVAARSDADASRGLLKAINTERSKRDLRPVAGDAAITTAATRHSRWMAQRNELTSRGVASAPELRRLAGRFTVLVGAAPSVRQVVRELMLSGFHRRALLGPYRVAGAAAHFEHGKRWVTIILGNLAQHPSARSYRPPARSPAAAPASTPPAGRRTRAPTPPPPVLDSEDQILSSSEDAGSVVAATGPHPLDDGEGRWPLIVAMLAIVATGLAIARYSDPDRASR